MQDLMMCIYLSASRSWIYIGGVEQKVCYFVLDLPQNDGCSVNAYLAGTSATFCDGQVSAFALLEREPRDILYDSTRARMWISWSWSPSMALSPSKVR